MNSRIWLTSRGRSGNTLELFLACSVDEISEVLFMRLRHKKPQCDSAGAQASSGASFVPIPAATNATAW
jgi:hypothetical protein